jgi:serine/threonine-protein kinase HipA
MAELAREVVERSIAVPGVQPKLSLSLVNDAITGAKQNRLTVVGALGGNYILKPPSPLYSEMPENEHVTMRIAQSYGIRTVNSSLIRLQSGELSYITKRIDRKGSGEKIHMLDMFQILEAYDKYKGSMERVGNAIGKYSVNTLLDKLYYFELSVFCFLTGNNDMHLKNFSLIENGGGWTLSPAYDLLNVTIANPGDDEEMALTLDGRKKKLTRENLEKFGHALDLNQKQIENAFKRIKKYKPDAFELINNSFLSAEFKEKYLMLVNERHSRLLN